MAWRLADQFTPKNRTPGKCSGCGCPLRKRPLNPSGREQALLPGIVIDFEGDVEFCETCISEAAELLGYITPDVANAQQDTIDMQVARIETLNEKSQEQNALIRSLTYELNRTLTESDAKE